MQLQGTLWRLYSGERLKKSKESFITQLEANYFHLRLNGNTTPLTAWALMELIKDPLLLRAVREEILQAYIVDPDTGRRNIDAQRLISLPLMQSFYVEILRMHVSFNVTREVQQPLSIDGYPIEKGSLVQAYSQIAHMEESVWGVEEHPASEFWAERHLRYVDGVDESGNIVQQAQFSMRGRPSSFFPYGKRQLTCHSPTKDYILGLDKCAFLSCRS